MGNYDFRFTVFTPTYNRSYIIENLYESLKRQKFQNFEWVVVDDGSQDDTEEKFRDLMARDHAFPIRYVRTENGGKHRAINKGLEMARGELFFIVDSDDYLTDDALELADNAEKTIEPREKNRFAGVCGQRGYDANTPLGTSFQGKILDITMRDRPKYGITGDKSEVFYTDLLKKYPFPQFEGENFVTESVVWDPIAADGYVLRFTQDILVVCKYLRDGLTAEGNERLFRKNPKGYGLFLSQRIRYDHWSFQMKWDYYKDYYYRFRDRFSMAEMAGYLHCSRVEFYAGIRLIQIFQKISDRK